MPRRSTISGLPADIKAWLQQRLRDAGFADYDHLTDQLNQRIAEHGSAARVSRSALHRFGKEFEIQIKQMEQDARASSYLVDVLGDDADTVSRANILLAQSSIQRLLLQAEDRGLEPKELGALVRATADAARTSISQAKWKTEVEARAKQAAKATEDIIEKSGTTLTPDTLKQIREQIYGIAA